MNHARYIDGIGVERNERRPSKGKITRRGWVQIYHGETCHIQLPIQLERTGLQINWYAVFPRVLSFSSRSVYMINIMLEIITVAN